MLKAIRKMSLRARLVLLAAFAIVALMVALFVAWRLARATETFALRQADASIHAAARDLARELEINPDGYLTFEQATAGPADRRHPRGPERRPTRVPPHVEALFSLYSDPLARLTAITLHRYPNVEGGFYRPSDAAIIGYATQTDSSARRTVPPDVIEFIRAPASQTSSTNAPASSTTQIGADRVLLVAYPAQDGGIEAAWAMQRLPHVSGVSDWPNVIALFALALSIIAVSGLALMTLRDVRSGVSGIETGLAALTNDLDRRLASPDTEELARIASAINELAATLRANLARQGELEQELNKRERLSALGRLVAGVAHEVRNPLSAMKLKVQLARRSSYPPEKLDETFSVIIAEIERLDSLVRRLLELGAQRTVELRPVDLVELVNGRTAFFTDIASQSNVKITMTGTSEKLVVQGDRDRLGQVVDNLIQNAIDAMPSGGQLTIVCDRIGTEKGFSIARLSFNDTGQGIPESDREHIFEPFHTGRDTGTGLGLAIARAIVEEHGGQLSFVSSNGSGATFVVELPLAPAGERVGN